MFDSPIAYLNSNNDNSIFGFGKGAFLAISESESIELIDEFIERNKDKYVFCTLSFDIKNKFERLTSNNSDKINFPFITLFTTEYVTEIKSDSINFIQGNKNEISLKYATDFLNKRKQNSSFDIHFKSRTSKKHYLEKLDAIKKHIKLGDIYEVNFCQEFFAENIKFKDPESFYWKVNEITKAPYSGFIDLENHSVFCGSPERYIQKKGNTIYSQPIKGTAKRGGNELEDAQLKEELQNDPKERAENIMVVDLVRNDLSRIALKNSVKVDELCEIYTFETVHQMISTISCQIKENTLLSEILKATFPMGSMTGVPKIRALEIIEKYEDFNRGLYSGSIGYIKPNGDFDFNVVIRSFIHNKQTNYLSCAVGGAITDLSIPEQEYEECFVKVKRILDAINE